MIGETLFEEFGEITRQLAHDMAVMLAGGAEDDRSYLNTVVPKSLADARSEVVLHVLTSENDPLHEMNVRGLTAACATNPRLSLDLTVGDYVQHGGVSRPFRPFARTKIPEILASVEEMKPTVTS